VVTTRFEPQTAEEWGPAVPHPTAEQLAEARRTIRDLIPSTPVVRAWGLEPLAGCEVYLKLETFNPLNAFKVRGALNVIRHLDPATRARGVVCASTGNFGQSIAWAARAEGVEATVCVPVGANPVKVGRIRALGARIVEVGKDFDEARLHADSLAQETGACYAHSANDTLLVAGAGTHAAELLEAIPDLDAIYVPVGGGSGAAGSCLARQAAGSSARVIGVQSAQAPALHESWAQHEGLKTDYMRTRADGLATRSAFRLTFEMLGAMLDEFLLVDDEALVDAAGRLLATTRVLAEEAGAAGLAGVLSRPGQHAGKKVGVIVSGGNPSPDSTRLIVEAALRNS
jgi:threonine dehydratase